MLSSYRSTLHDWGSHFYSNISRYKTCYWALSKTLQSGWSYAIWSLRWTTLVLVIENVLDHFFTRVYSLEQHLTKLLREHHVASKSCPAPHPTIATMGMTKKQRIAATKPYNLPRIERMKKTGDFIFLRLHLKFQVPMIHKIIEAAKHAELLRRVEKELDSIAKEIAEPNIHIHWPIIQNPVHTSIKVHFR